MVEPVSLAASIASILKGVTTACVYLDGVRKASLEAAQVAAQLEGTKAILTALKISIETQHRPSEFLALWGPSAKMVLDNVKVTMELLNNKLGSASLSGGSVRLSFWNKAIWPLGRQESMVLQQQLQGYLQMLSLVQNGLLQYIKIFF